MQLIINGEDKSFDEPLTLEQLLGRIGLEAGRVAVERNREIVSRDQFPTIPLAEKDSIEILHFVGGG